MVRVLAATLLLAVACGRLDFDRSAPRDGAPGDGALVVDATACASDSDCASPCTACTEHVCVPQPINSLALGHRSTCFLGESGSRWCAGEWVGLGSDSSISGVVLPQRNVGEDGWSALFPGWDISYGVRNGMLDQWMEDAASTVYSADATWVEIVVDLGSSCFRHTAGDIDCDGMIFAGPWLDVAVGVDAADNIGYCAVKADHTLWCWGTDESNDLGQGAEANGTTIAAPTQVGTATDWAHVAMSDGLTCAQKTDNTVWCMGDPTSTGTNGVDPAGVPMQISARTDWAWLRVQWEHGCAGTADDSDIECWGRDDYGLQVVTGMASVPTPTPIVGSWDDFRMGGHHYCGHANGQWYCWGYNGFGQLANGTTGSGTNSADLQSPPTTPLCGG